MVLKFNGEFCDEGRQETFLEMRALNRAEGKEGLMAETSRSYFFGSEWVLSSSSGIHDDVLFMIFVKPFVLIKR